MVVGGGGTVVVVVVVIGAGALLFGVVGAAGAATGAVPPLCTAPAIWLSPFWRRACALADPLPPLRAC